MSDNTDWIPLESNPLVFNSWANQAGLDISSGDQFYDLYGLDAEFLATIPRPVKAVILVFPWTEARYRRAEEDEQIAREGNPVDSSVFWMKQTIHNACGAMAIIHSLANADVTLVEGSPLDTFYKACRSKPPLERSRLLEQTPIFREIHASVADKGQVPLPETNDRMDQAYTCFIRTTAGRVIELDGGRSAAVDRGECTDLLEDVARIAGEEFIGKSSSIKFSMMYLGHASV
ncbi:cysteine proteinase [Gymnopus androsaceus JB14]|uniref:Ubiquitin carboxyl-terminal hydrolase n=1 Tax=Gymnopus androsaceus JB14 TaxID=1447944 RepID=A0A6A4ICW1_9AGAR|nr:cysteine proteinase [Gymnopus androsaceus JB14]